MPEPLEPPPMHFIEDLDGFVDVSFHGLQFFHDEAVPVTFWRHAELLDRLGADPDERERSLRALRDRAVASIDQWHTYAQTHRWTQPLPEGIDDPSPVVFPGPGLLGPAVDTPRPPETLPDVTGGPDEPPATGPMREDG